MVCICLENSNTPCVIHGTTFDVHVISVSPSQNAMLSPNQRGTSWPKRGTPPLESNWRPILKWRMKFSALLAMSCTRSGVVTKSIARCAWRENKRVNPSGQQNCAGHSGALLTDW